MKIGIVGNGFVGKATALFACPDIKVLIYDIDPEKCEPKGIILKDISECKFVFICVPTPINNHGECHTKIVEDCVNSIKYLNTDCHIIVRSTVPPGTCHRLGVHHMPEFLTEKNWKDDFWKTKTWIVGINNDDFLFKEHITDLIKIVKHYGNILHDSITFLDTNESEMIKYTRNCYLATKVSFFNEIYDFCEKKNIDYDNVRKWTVDDPRIGETHTKVPGHDGRRGYGGTCLPKDIQALTKEFEKEKITSYILKASIDRNTIKDRKEQDWKVNKGRSII